MEESQASGKTPIRGASIRLAVLCMGLYTVTYICRKAFDSNINEIKDAFLQGDSAVGLIGTCFFIAYAIGQVIHGALCRFYSPRPVLFGMGMAVAGLNLTMGLIPVRLFPLLKFIWMANGFVCASFWSLLIMTLNRCVAEEHKTTVMLISSFPVALGTLCSYGISALLSFFGRFRISFFVSAALMVLAAVYWLIRSPRLMDACLAEKKEKDGDVLPKLAEKNGVGGKPSREFLILFGTLAFFAVINNLIKDGLNTWTPTVLTDTYGMKNWLAVLLSVLVPIMSLFAGLISLFLYRKIKNFPLICGILYGATGFILTAMMGLFPSGSWAVTLVCLMAASLLMSAVNNVLTSLFPLNVEKGINAGTVAGFIDGFCYLGSAASAWGIGKMAEEQGGFSGVFRMMILLSFFSTLIALFTFSQKVKAEKKSAPRH